LVLEEKEVDEEKSIITPRQIEYSKEEQPRPDFEDFKPEPFDPEAAQEDLDLSGCNLSTANFGY